MLGWTPDEYQNQSTRLIYPDDEAYKNMWQVFLKAFQVGGLWDVEITLQRKDGTVIDARVKGRAVNPKDPSDGAVWLMEDVTEKKARDAEHAAIIEQLRHSQKIAGLASWEYLPQTDTHLWSDELYQRLGYAPEDLDLNLETMLKLSHPDDLEKVREGLNSIISGTADTYSVVHRVYKRDGSELVIHDHGVPERDENGDVIRVTGVSQDVTNLVLAEQALGERDAYIRGLLATTSAAIATADTRGHLKYWNKAYEEFTGYSRAELEVLGNQGTSHPDDLAEAAKVYSRLETGEIDEFRREKKFRRKDGTTAWGDLSASAVRDRDGALAEVIGVIIDITEKKRTEEALRKRESLLTTVLESTYDGLVTLEPIRNDSDQIIDFRYTSANDSAVTYLGRDLVGVRVLDAHPNSPEDGMYHRYVESIETGKPVQTDQHMAGLLAGDPWWRFVVVPTRQGLSVGFNDITEERRAVEELQGREALLSSVLERSFGGLVTLKVLRNADGGIDNFQYTSAIGDAVKIFGQNPIGKLFTEIFPTSRQTGQFDRYRRVVETGEAADIEAQYTDILPDDPWLRLVAVPLDDGLAIAFTDVTEQRNASDALKVAYAEMEQRVEERTGELQSELVQRRRTQVELELEKERAEEASKAKSEFLSRMSHELRTPMNAILGFSQLLQHDKTTHLTGNQPGFVDEIMSAGNHLMLLISQLLDMSKIETGNMNLSVVTVSPNPLIEECITMTRSQAEEHDVTISDHTVELELPTIEADPLRFKQVLLNLLSNAVKYNRTGGSIEIDCADTGLGLLCFTIKDEGAGVPKNKRHSIFEPFNRAGAEDMAVPGTGIGLAIAKQMVELMGGEIGVADADGGGSKFWFTVPTTQTGQETS